VKRERKKRLTRSDLKALGVSPGLVVRRVRCQKPERQSGQDTRRRGETLTTDKLERTELEALDREGKGRRGPKTLRVNTFKEELR
jgi:hypothetical protein